MKSIVLIMLCIGLSFYLYSYKAAELTKEEMIAYLKNEENGLCKERAIGDVKMKMNYHPNYFLIEQELKTLPKPTESDRDSICNQYKDNLYFKLNLSIGGEEVLGSRMAKTNMFGEMVNILSFRMGDYLYMTTSQNDTLALKSYVYPRMYGAAPSTEMLLAFDRKSLEENEFITLHLKELGLQTGLNRFRFYKEDIEKITLLNFEQNCEL